MIKPAIQDKIYFLCEKYSAMFVFDLLINLNNKILDNFDNFLAIKTCVSRH